MTRAILMPQTSVDTGGRLGKTVAAAQGDRVGEMKYCGGMVMSELGWLSVAHNSPAWVHPRSILRL
jgi:hypothetical protein